MWRALVVGLAAAAASAGLLAVSVADGSAAGSARLEGQVDDVSACVRGLNRE